MSLWIDQWRSFIKETSYKHILTDKGISNDWFWQSYQVYDEVMRFSGYPGEIPSRISSFIRPDEVLLDIGAGTGAFAIPLARVTKKVIAVDPSLYHQSLLAEKARKERLTNIVQIAKEWMEITPSEIGAVDHVLAAYSLFDEEIEAFLKKMIDISSKEVFMVFRAEKPDPLNEFAYGPRLSADYQLLHHILEDMGYSFRVEIFDRSYALPMDLVMKQYRFSNKSREDLEGFLRDEKRLIEKDDGSYATFCSKDALLHMIR